MSGTNQGRFSRREKLGRREKDTRFLYGGGVKGDALMRHKIHTESQEMRFISCVVSGRVLKKLYSVNGATEPT